jgi:sugar/nucleoside kinase (ribokinase family)
MAVVSPMLVSGVGCCLMDNLYNHIDFNSDVFRKYLSRQPGDGGLSPGRLVFAEEFERFADRAIERVLADITGGKEADARNVGGPCIVAMISAAQLAWDRDVSFRFYGARGEDSNSRNLVERLSATDVDISGYKVVPDNTPFTDVFSDPDYAQGQGERIFVNSIGAAGAFAPEDLPADFFDSRICIFGGTALVPQIHDNLTILLDRAKQAGAFTVVNTVYDFRNERRHPGQAWPLGQGTESYQSIDLLIMDNEEAQKISGTQGQQALRDYFANSGVSSFIITHGAEPVTAFSDGRVFAPCAVKSFPVSQRVKRELATPQSEKGDTTGCGDNFVGGALASLVMQLQDDPAQQPDLGNAVAWAVASGGTACFYMGGAFAEQHQGQRHQQVLPYYHDYKEQIDN